MKAITSYTPINTNYTLIILGKDSNVLHHSATSPHLTLPQWKKRGRTL